MFTLFFANQKLQNIIDLKINEYCAVLIYISYLTFFILAFNHWRSPRYDSHRLELQRWTFFFIEDLTQPRKPV